MQLTIVTDIYILSDDLSVEDHVHVVISSAAQTLHALRVLRGHGMDDAALQMVVRAVVVSKLHAVRFVCVVGVFDRGR